MVSKRHGRGRRKQKRSGIRPTSSPLDRGETDRVAKRRSGDGAAMTFDRTPEGVPEHLQIEH